MRLLLLCWLISAPCLAQNSGILKVKKADATYDIRTVRSESNILYLGIANLIEFIKPDSAYGIYDYFTTNGTVGETWGKYQVARPQFLQETLIGLLQKKTITDSPTVLIQKRFEVRELPVPSVSVSGFTGPTVSVSEVLGRAQLQLQLEWDPGLQNTKDVAILDNFSFIVVRARRRTKPGQKGTLTFYDQFSKTKQALEPGAYIRFYDIRFYYECEKFLPKHLRNRRLPPFILEVVK